MNSKMVPQTTKWNKIFLIQEPLKKLLMRQGTSYIQLSGTFTYV